MHERDGGVRVTRGKAACIVLAVVGLALLTCLVLFTPIDAEAATPEPASSVPATALDTVPMTDAATAPATADTTVAAATSGSCPEYIAVVDPNTGGTVIVDRCGPSFDDAGDAGESSATTATADSQFGHCRTVTRRVYGRNSVGWKLIYGYLTKHWCWKNGKVTYRPTTGWDHGVTQLGSIGQWDDVSTVEKNTWNSADGSESYSWATQKFRQCIPSPFGCIKVGEHNLTARIHAFGDGSYHFGG